MHNYTERYNKMIALTEDRVENYVGKLQRKGVDVRWEGWNLVFHRPNKGALRKPEGRHSRNTGEWGFETTVSPNEFGQWILDYRLTKV